MPKYIYIHLATGNIRSINIGYFDVDLVVRLHTHTPHTHTQTDTIETGSHQICILENGIHYNL